MKQDSIKKISLIELSFDTDSIDRTNNMDIINKINKKTRPNLFEIVKRLGGVFLREWNFPKDRNEYEQ